MSSHDDKLAQACGQVADLAQQISNWVASDDALLGIERSSLGQEVRRFETRARALGDAVGHRPCVGVAGPSHSGKTHLITGFAGRKPAPLTAEFDGLSDGIDFLRQIRSDGPQVSGIITRFSSEQPATPAKFPVEVTLLSHVDVIKILASAYFSGAASGRVRVPRPEQIEAICTRIGRQLSLFPVSGLSEDDVWSIRSYLEKSFADSPAIRALAAGGYWDYFTSLAPRLPQTGRLSLLSVLWGGLETYSTLYEEAVMALEKLGHERLAYCAMAALANVDPDTGQVSAIADSIINVEPLLRLGQKDDEAILVRSKHGHWAAIARSVLTALVGEVRIALHDCDSELFERADVLEFPGLRPSANLPGLGGDAISARQDLIAIYARFKAGHLLEKYCNLNEVTSLVVCVDPDTQDIGGMSHVVSNWVEMTHGSSAGERQLVDNGLFLVLTKLDKSFPLIDQQQDSDANGASDWTLRLEGALSGGVGRGQDWPREWTPGRAFDNVFLLRSPYHFAGDLCDYLNNGMELCVKSSRVNHVAIARDKFTQNETVCRHVSDPAAAWQEALEPGDGGVTYLAQSIESVCNDLERHRQIAHELSALRRTMRDRLQRFHVSDDLFAQRDTRRRSAHMVVRELRHCADKQLFGQLLRTLNVPEGEFACLFYNLETNPYSNASHSGEVARPVVTLSESLDELGARSQANTRAAAGDGEQAADADPQAAAGKTDATSADRFARAAVQYWSATMRTISNAPHMSRRFQVPGPVLSFLVDEIIAGAARRDLQGAIARRIQQGFSGQTNTSQRTAKAAIIAADAIGSFTNWLGFDQTWAENHPRRKGRSQMVIFPPREETGLASIGDVRSRLGKAFFADWSLAYMTMVEENAENLRQTRFDAEQDHKLGELLRELNLTEFWPVFRSAS